MAKFTLMVIFYGEYPPTHFYISIPFIQLSLVQLSSLNILANLISPSLFRKEPNSPYVSSQN